MGISTPRKIDIPSETPQKMTVKRPMSVRKINEMVQPSESKVVSESVGVRRKQFSRAELMDYWTQFMVQNPKLHILVNSMRTAIITQLQDDTYKIIVENPTQKSAFETAMPQLLNFLRNGLENDMLAFEVEVSVADERPKMLSSQDLLVEVMEKNSKIRELLINFDVELTM